MPHPNARPLLVIGAGNGGKGAAADLATRGYDVTMWGRTPERIQSIAEQGGIDLVDQHGNSRVAQVRVTDDMASALRNASTVLVVIPAIGHRDVARECAPFLTDTHRVVLIPGRTGGALEFRAALREAGCSADVAIAEIDTLPYVARAEGGARVRISRRKQRLSVATLPAPGSDQLVEDVKKMFPAARRAPSVLTTSLTTIGAVFHPGIVLSNLDRISPDIAPFDFYREGPTQKAVELMNALDRERCAVANAYGVQVPTAMEWLSAAYGTAESDLASAMRSSYPSVPAPTTVQHRYLNEDVPFGLLPMRELGRLAGVPTPTIDATIDHAAKVTGHDYEREGRTLARLGLAECSASDLVAAVGN